jgi:undecaprenyl diphosphate synthase
MTRQAVPEHVGLIIDGNRRWAKEHGLPPWEGHLAGITALEDVLRQFVESGVKHISFYTWSTENWKRAEDEVTAFMGLIRRMFKNELKRLLQEDCRFVALGERSGMPSDILEMIEDAEEESKNNARATLVMCFNYGGQQEIAGAARRIVEAGVKAEDITNELFEQYIDHPDIPPCDLVVRTSGEQRLSNFMLWRSAYSEFLFLDKYWPDMRPEDVAGILEEYNRRNRRHGG